MRYAILLFASLSTFVQAQTPRTTSTRNAVWGAALFEYAFHPKWSASLDAQYRYEYTDGDAIAWLLRPGVSYKIKSGLMFTAGFARFKLYPNPNGREPRPEWRPWQEVGQKYILAGGKHTIYPRLRFEQRFIREYEGGGFTSNYALNSMRLRLRADYTYKFHPEAERTTFLFAGDELFFLRNPTGYTGLDQNRIWIGAGYKFNSIASVAFSYLNWYQQVNSSTYVQFHVVRIQAQFQFTRKEKKA